MYLSISRVLTRDRRDPLGSSSPARSLAKAEARAATTRAGIVTKDSRIRRAHGSASADRTRGRAGYQFDRSCVCRAGCPTNNDSGGVWTGAPPFASAILSRGASRDAPDVPRARSRERGRGSEPAEARLRSLRVVFRAHRGSDLVPSFRSHVRGVLSVATPGSSWFVGGLVRRALRARLVLR